MRMSSNAVKAGSTAEASLPVNTEPVAIQHPADWDVRRVLGDNYSKYRAYEPPADNRNLRRWAAAYGVLGVFTCVAILAMANHDQSSSFLVYLACANVAAFGLRLTSSQSVLPAGFLF